MSNTDQSAAGPFNPVPGDSGGATGGGAAGQPAEGTPWVSQPRYGAYAPGGAPVYGDPGYSGPAYGAGAAGGPGYAGGAGYGSMPYAPAPPPPPLAHPKPGILPLRPWGLGDIFAGAWHAVWHNPAVMLGLPILIILLASIVSALLGLALNAPVNAWFESLLRDTGIHLSDFNFGNQNIAMATGSSVTAGLLMALVTPIINGILAISISQAVLGNRPSIHEAWDRVKGRIGALIGWSILMTIGLVVAATLAGLAIAGLLIALGGVSGELAGILSLLVIIALVALFSWLAIKLLFVAPIIAIERASLGQAVRRSWELSRGNFWRILGVYLLGTLLLSLITGMLSAPLAAISAGVALGTGGTIVPFILDIVRIAITNAITMVFTAGLVTLLYLDSRMRSEGLHNSMISATSGSTSAGTIGGVL